MSKHISALKWPLLVVIVLLTVSCGAHYVWIEMECPSPDGKLNAVFWDEGGGGAAGWVQAYLTVLPTQPVTLAVIESRSGRVFKFRHGDVRLIWQDAHSLQVEYTDSAVVDYALPAEPSVLSLLELKVQYRGVPGGLGGVLRDGSLCESGGHVIAVPPSRRLR